MPIHDWTRVDAGIFHAFHQQWIVALGNMLNNDLLPPQYYALPEQFADGFGPDVLALQGSEAESIQGESPADAGGLLVAAPRVAPTAESDWEFYHRKQSTLAVRHVSGDRVVAIVEIVSPGNKSTAHAVRSFVQKAAEFLTKRVHLLVIDLFPPGRRDPQGLPAMIWDEVSGQLREPPGDKPLAVASFEAATLSLRTYMQPVAVGDALPDMPLFLQPDGCVHIPLEAVYQTAYTAMPWRWRKVLEQ
ncbi:MAG: DUF4058 family protein [Pirellulales bacterium]